MVELTVVASVVALLSILLQHGIRAQPTIDSSTEGDSCSQLEDDMKFCVEENMRLRSLQETNRQTIDRPTLESERETVKRLENELRRLRSRELKTGNKMSTFIAGAL